MATEDQNIKITFDTNAGKAAVESNKFAGALDNVEDAGAGAIKSMKNLDATFDEVYDGMKPLTARMGEAEDRLYELALAGDTASKEYQGLLEKVAQYRKTQIETDRVVDAAATTLGQKLGGAAQIAATGVQGVTAGMALFGDQSEETEKALLKVQAAMAFADAISSVSTLGGQWNVLKSSIASSSIATKANTAATGAAAMVQNLFTGSVNTSSAGFKGLKLAIAGTGIGLLVVGLALVITNFSKIKEVVLKVVPGLASVGKLIGSIVDSVTDFIGVTSEADRAIDRMKANADTSIALNKKFLAEHGSQLDEFTKQKIEAKNKYNEAIKEDGADQVALAKELNRELAKIEYSRGDERRKIAEENAKKATEDAEKRRQKKKDDAERTAKEEADALKKIADDKLADEMKSAQDAVNIVEQLKQNIETPAQKEQREYEEKKAILEANNLSIEELTVQHIDKLAEIQKTADEKAAEEKKARDEKALEDQKRIDQQIIEQKKAVQDGQLNLADSAVGFLSRIAGKNKALQKAAIIAESALGIGKSVIATNASNVAATAQGAALAIPTAGASVAAAAGLVATNYVTLGLGVAGNIAATAKALQALGGGSAPSAGGASGGVVRGSTPPTVAFNNSAENQIGQSVAKTQAEQPPLQVTVLESDISKAQNNVKVLENKNSF